MIYKIEPLPHGKVYVEFTDCALDHHLSDPVVTDQLTPEEAEEMALRLIVVAASLRGRLPELFRIPEEDLVV